MSNLKTEQKRLGNLVCKSTVKGAFETDWGIRETRQKIQIRGSE